MGATPSARAHPLVGGRTPHLPLEEGKPPGPVPAAPNASRVQPACPWHILQGHNDRGGKRRRRGWVDRGVTQPPTGAAPGHRRGRGGHGWRVNSRTKPSAAASPPPPPPTPWRSQDAMQTGPIGATIVLVSPSPPPPRTHPISFEDTHAERRKETAPFSPPLLALTLSRGPLRHRDRPRSCNGRVVAPR